jgi:hypothetical protein
MTEAEWFSKPIVDLLCHAHAAIPTVPSRWLETLRRSDMPPSPSMPLSPLPPSPWPVGNRGRKHLLLTLAITRLYWGHLSQPSRDLVERLQQEEELPPKPPTDEEFRYSHELADLVYRDVEAYPGTALPAGMNAVWFLSAGPWEQEYFDDFMEMEPAEQYESWRPLIYDVFGNPFRPVAVDPAWLTSTVVALARQMYESRDFSALPILADALQDAGCCNEDVLDHCRGPRPHVRGCWAVDLVLGKE